MKQNSLCRFITLIFFFLAVVACAVTPPVDNKALLPRDELLRGSEFGFEASASIEDVDTLALNDEMRIFLAQHVPTGASDHKKVELILGAILEGGLHLNYNNFKTLTAQQAFYQREANCLSFTNLFVALAREAGIDAQFQVIDIPPSWSQRGVTYLNNRHLNVLVNLTGRSQIVDFDMASYDTDYERRVISDREALAQFHNNMGVYWLGENNSARAFQNFRKALEINEHTGYFWTNLGTLYRRAGYLDKAEAAFKVAIGIDNDATALSNLSRLYNVGGEDELSEYYASQVELFRRSNPFYLYDLAREAYFRQDYREAEQLIRIAIRLRNDEHTFYQLLGLSYIRMGEKATASKFFERAASLASDADHRERYNRKLESLASN